MKKKIAVLLCVLMMISVFTVAAAAEGEGEEKLWDFWSLLSIFNVDYLGVITMLLTSLGTIFRIFNGSDGIQGFFEWLFGALKNIIPGA